jgi:hypothetical protein
MRPGLFLFVLVPMAINIMATPMLVLMLVLADAGNTNRINDLWR